MKASKFVSKATDKTRLHNKCMELVSQAEDIKTASQWPLPPISQRTVTRTEEIILLEGSKLHGFIFPKWTSEPKDSVFEEVIDGCPVYTHVTSFYLFDLI